ncbi:MAG TPA: hypothetical protein VMH91_04140 [Candidatus Paceibacterota bacterium]|nr:hypothetical protein [Candidatus Paceibacterota bacterium]
MQAGTELQARDWYDSLPASAMVYPEQLWDRVKYLFWTFYTPYHPLVRDTALRLRVVRHEGRQDFLIGTIAPHLSIPEFISHLLGKGYGNHFVAWKDDGEVVSLRYTDGFAYQYHVRVFEDREVRAHYEYTPECYPISHIMETDMEARREEFLSLLGDTIVAHVPSAFSD